MLLNAWATWCNPCAAELPALQRLHERSASQGLRVVGVSIDHEDAMVIRDFLREHGATYPNLMGRQYELEKAFGWGKGVPQTVLIDRDGRIVRYWHGMVMEDPGMDALLDRLLAS